MKKVTVPKFIIIGGALLLVIVSFILGYKCSESLVKEEDTECKPEIRFVEKCDNPTPVVEEFKVGENKYIITTNTKFLTMQNDGGSHTNVYYEIDLNTNKVNKKEDKYVGFKGYEYQGKLVNEKTLTSEEATEVKNIIDEAIAHKDDVIEVTDYKFYTLTTAEDEEIRIIDNEVIDKLNTLLG